MEYTDFLYEYSQRVEPLYRGFSKKEHLDMFMSGKIRLVNYRYYRINRKNYNNDKFDYESEDTRYNEEEGLARNIRLVDSDGSIKNLTAYGFATSHYILCFYKNLETMKIMDGKDKDAYQFKIELKNPLELHERIISFLNYNQRHYIGNMVNPEGLVLTVGQYNPEIVSIYSDTKAQLKQEYRFSYHILEEKDNNGFLFSNNSKYVSKGKLVATRDSKLKENISLPDFYTIDSIKVDDICDICLS